tara:strand:- start:406 stop:1605 length:1200 start_codon:yes stop_codon:yes gene_type:complete
MQPPTGLNIGKGGKAVSMPSPPEPTMAKIPPLPKLTGVGGDGGGDKNIFQKGLDWTKNAVGGAWNWIKEGTKANVEKVKAFVSNTAENINNSDAANWVRDKIGSEKGDGFIGPKWMNIRNPFAKKEETNVKSETPLSSNKPLTRPSSSFSGTEEGGVPRGLSRDEYFWMVYDLAKKHGAKYPEIAAAQAMHETGWMGDGPSVFNATGRTNAFGQSGKGDKGSIKGDRDWAAYSSLDAAVKDHVKLWHDVGNHSENYNAHDTRSSGLAAVIPAYSPNADPANIRLGFSEDAYTKDVLNTLRKYGFDPMLGPGNSTSHEVSLETPNAEKGAISPASDIAMKSHQVQQSSSIVDEIEDQEPPQPIVYLTNNNIATSPVVIIKKSSNMNDFVQQYRFMSLGAA